jgi:hypothetical protein
MLSLVKSDNLKQHQPPNNRRFNPNRTSGLNLEIVILIIINNFEKTNYGVGYEISDRNILINLL